MAKIKEIYKVVLNDLKEVVKLIKCRKNYKELENHENFGCKLSYDKRSQGLNYASKEECTRFGRHWVRFWFEYFYRWSSLDWRCGLGINGNYCTYPKRKCLKGP